MSETSARSIVSERDLTGESYDTRERVHVEGQSGVLVVLATVEERADRFELTPNVTLAGFYPDCEPSDRVAICMYERALDRERPGWREEPVAMLRRWGRIDQMGDAPQVEAYPVGKLDRYTAGNYTNRDGLVVCENCTEWVETVPDWVRHVARECEGVSDVE